MAKKIDCVVPLHSKDFDRFDLLKRSMQKFWAVEGSISVVTPQADCEVARDLVADDPRFVVRSETELVPELASSSAAGWWKQQAIKIAFHQVADADFYLTLDADCLAVRPIKYEDLVFDGRGLMQYEPWETHEDWYALSSILLDMPFPQAASAVSVTPFLFASRNVERLCQHLEQKLGVPWSNVFLESTGPTEYTLYHIFISAIGRWKEHHLSELDPTRVQMFGNCLWDDNDQTNWTPNDSFQNPAFLFSVLQSNTNIPLDYIREQVLPFLR